MELSLLLAAAAAVFAMITMIVAIVILIKVSGLSGNSFQEYEDAIENDLSIQRNEINQRLDSVSRTVSEGFSAGFGRILRAEADNMQTLRQTVNDRLGAFERTVSSGNAALDQRMEDMRRSQDTRLDAVRETTAKYLTEIGQTNSTALREGLEAIGKTEAENLTRISSALSDRLGSFEKTMSSGSEALDKRMEAMRRSQEESLDRVRAATERQLTDLREANQKKLDEIEGTVAEKLDKTLAERVSESFKNVSDQLEKVYKGLGEMQSLASDVGSLKNALTNVKVRGEMGEIQLARILEQILAAEQYEENVITKKGSKDPVEFAIRIPSKDAENEFIYLPVDAKFPLDTYNALCDAYESGDKLRIDAARKALYTRIRTDAGNIRDKYISPPDTTDFGILFLPTEGLFAEIIRNAELTEKLRTEFKVTVCGPSTITAFLNSLQMGFRTLTYEKKSGQIARTLSEVKTEFGKFGESLAKVQKNIDATGKELDNLVGRRTRAINRKLSTIESLPAGEPMQYLSAEDE